MSSSKQLLSIDADSDNYSNVRVALRIRPQLAREKIEACRVCTFVTENEPQVTLGNNKSFTYDYVYDMGTNQSIFYETCCRSLVEGCFNGYNATVLAYGQTGSGKTYTMGTSFDNNVENDAGIIPRALHNLFEGLTERKANSMVDGVALVDFTISVEFMELYNEEIIDLLDPTRIPGQHNRVKLKIHEDQHGSICVAGMTAREVTSAQEALKCLHEGALNRTTASTQMNSQSSRSHAIFSVLLKQTRSLQTVTNEQGPSLGQNFESLSAKLHFTDLAGSERLKRTGATGERMREGVSINSGLLALGNVISALGDISKKSTHVPYRDSKLTRVLQDSLGGNSRTLMVACVSPSDSDFMETLNTLKYANRARNIKNKVVVNQDSSSKQIQQLRQQIANLQLELTEYRTGKRVVSEEGCAVYNDLYQECTMLRADNKNLRLKIKVVQETSETLKKQVVNMKTVAATVKSADSDAKSTVEEMIGGYISEIEELQTKLIESQSMCATLQSKFNKESHHFGSGELNTSFDGDSGLSRPKTPLMNVLLQAKKDIQTLEMKRQQMQQSSISDDDDEDNNDIDESALYNSNEEEEDGSDEEEFNEKEAEQRDTDLEESRSELKSLEAEVNIKQQLVDELESLQRRLIAMQSQYERKLQVMLDRIKTTEQERDKVLSKLDSKKEGDKEKIGKVHAMYHTKIEAMKAQIKSVQEAQKKHQKLLEEKNKNLSQLNSLKSELKRLRSTKEKLDKRLKDDDKKNREHSMKLTKEMLRLKNAYTKKSAEMKRLENKNRQKDHAMLRKAKEIEVLKSNLNNIQRKRTVTRNRVVSSRQRISHRARVNTVNAQARRSEAAVVDPKSVWVRIEQLLNKIAMRNETIAAVERQMQRLIRDREQLVEARKALLSRCDDHEDVAQEIDDVETNAEFVDEQIQTCQIEIMQLEKGSEDLDRLRVQLDSCTLNSSKYVADNLLSMLVIKFTTEAHAREKCKDLETKLKDSHESAQEAQALIHCLLQNKNNVDDSDTSSSITSDTPSPLDGPAKLLGTNLYRINALDDASPSVGNSSSSSVKARMRISRASAKDLLQIREERSTAVADRKNLVTPGSIPQRTSFTRHGSMREKLKLDKIERGNPASSADCDLFRSNSTVVSPSLRSPEVFSRLMTKPMQNTPHKGKMSLNHSKLSLSSLGLICTHVAEGHKKAVLCVQASDHLLFSGSKDRSVKVWNMVTGQEILSLDGHPNNVNVVRHCPNTGLVYTVSLCFVKIWDIRSKAACIRALSSSGGHHLPSSFYQRSIHRTNEMPDNEQLINDLHLSPHDSSRHLFVATGTAVNVWDLNKFAICTKLVGHQGNVMTMAVSHSSRPTIITGSKDHYVKIYRHEDWSASQGNCSPTATLSPPHMDGVESLAYLDEKNILFTSSRDKSIKKWDMTSQTVMKASYQAHSNWVCSLSAIKSRRHGSMLVSGGRNGVMKVWDVNTLNSLGELRAHTSNINCIASNSDSLFTASSDGTLKVWKYGT